MKKTLNESPLPNSDERITLTSTTTSMFYRYLFDNDKLILSDSSSTSFSDNCDLLTILCNRAILSNLDFITLLTNIDQSMLGTCLTNFNSSGILMHMSSIDLDNKSDYKKLSVSNFSLQNLIDFSFVKISGGLLKDGEGLTNKMGSRKTIIKKGDFKGKKFRYRAIGFYNHWNLDFPVEFLCYTPEEFNKLKEQILVVKEAVETGIEIK